MVYKFTPDDRDPWTQSRIDPAANSDIHPQAPAGGGGPGRFTSPGPLRLDLSAGTLHPDSPAASTIQVSRIVLCSATTGGMSGEVLVVRIGSIYKLEGVINGQPVVYIGKSNDIKRRFLQDGHEWKKLVEDKNTKISIRRVYGDIDVKASKRGTPASATNEALRSEEEKALRETEAEIESYNKSLKDGEPSKRILNEDRAATEENMNKWRLRHKVKGDEEWITIRNSGSSEIVFKAFIGMQILDLILDAINQERHRKMAQYIRAPYVFLESDGRNGFTVQTESRWWGLSTRYTKHYITGSLKGTEVEIGLREFNELKEEAEALYGYVDWWGDFVPGMLMPRLPVVNTPSDRWA